jgi:hypothetical protein
LDHLQLGESIWRIGIHTDPATLAQLIARGKREGVFALQVGKERQPIQTLEDPAV